MMFELRNWRLRLWLLRHRGHWTGFVRWTDQLVCLRCQKIAPRIR